MDKKITMTELARLANVDVSTVSRALSGSSLVREGTRRRIVELAEAVGYSINVSASNLRRQSSGAIGMVIPLTPDSDQTISDPFFLEMVGSVSQAASDHDYDLIISLPRLADQVSERRLLRSNRADGLIVIGQADRNARLNALAEITDRFVVWGARLDGASYTTVGSDNTFGGSLAGRHLIAGGCREILFVGDPALPEVQQRYRGLINAHAEAGLAWNENRVVRVNFGGRTAFEAVRSALETAPGIDGIFAASDLLAIAAIHAVQAQGRSIPDDVRVVGYDNIGQAAMTTPTLTTISQNIAQGGEMMVDLLLRKIAGEAVESAFTPTELIVRESAPG